MLQTGRNELRNDHVFHDHVFLSQLRKKNSKDITDCLTIDERG